MTNYDLAEKEKIEVDYWLNSPTEKPGADTVENLLNKLTDAPVFLERMKPFQPVFGSAATILELGAGQGWASCLVKKLYPHARVIASDISPYAIASVSAWEHVFRVKVDESFHCKSYEIPLPDSSVDVIFCFAAAHHFVAHRRTLREISRVLRPGGKCFYFHEPSCNRLMYRAAHYRVNRIRPDVPEDVLIYKRILELAGEAGLRGVVHADTSVLKRGPKELLYYWVLRAVPPLQVLLPCTRDFEFTKP